MNTAVITIMFLSYGFMDIVITSLNIFKNSLLFLSKNCLFYYVELMFAKNKGWIMYQLIKVSHIFNIIVMSMYYAIWQMPKIMTLIYSSKYDLDIQWWVHHANIEWYFQWKIDAKNVERLLMSLPCCVFWITCIIVQLKVKKVKVEYRKPLQNAAAG